MYKGQHMQWSPSGFVPDAAFTYASFAEAQVALTARAAAMEEDVAQYTVQCGGWPVVSGTFPAGPTSNPKQAFGDKKLTVALVPPALTLEAAPAFKEGGAKYGAYNYRDTKVEAMTYIAAILRHTYAYLDGEDLDPESTMGKTHLGGIAACVGILADARNKGMLIDNRPTKGTAGEVIRAAAGVVLPQKEETK